jgi:xanthine dehydrogenase YagT iron-sulfur-binding subunit
MPNKEKTGSRTKEAHDEPQRVHSSEDGLGNVSRRDFIKGTGVAGVAVTAGALLGETLLEASRTSAAVGSGNVLGPGPVPVTLQVNGQEKHLQLEPRVTLLDALRDRLDLTGAKKVCDRGTCGACTVIVDGKAIYSCAMLAIDAEGHKIETIEGLAPEGQLHPVSQAFVDNDAQQCGFCTPGFVMACKAYLDEEPHPTYEGVQKALGGNLCRCGTYMGVRRAVLEAAQKMKGGQA